MASERKINGSLYRFEPLLGWEAFDCLDALLDVMGPLAPVLETIMLEDEASRTSKLSGALATALQGRDREAVRKLVGMLIGGCRVDGQPCVVGVKPGSLSEMIEVAAFAGEAQFGSFFDGGAAGALARLMPAAQG